MGCNNVNTVRFVKINGDRVRLDYISAICYLSHLSLLIWSTHLSLLTKSHIIYYKLHVAPCIPYTLRLWAKATHTYRNKVWHLLQKLSLCTVCSYLNSVKIEELHIQTPAPVLSTLPTFLFSLIHSITYDLCILYCVLWQNEVELMFCLFSSSYFHLYYLLIWHGHSQASSKYL